MYGGGANQSGSPARGGGGDGAGAARESALRGTPAVGRFTPSAFMARPPEPSRVVDFASNDPLSAFDSKLGKSLAAAILPFGGLLSAAGLLDPTFEGVYGPGAPPPEGGGEGNPWLRPVAPAAPAATVGAKPSDPYQSAVVAALLGEEGADVPEWMRGLLEGGWYRGPGAAPGPAPYEAALRGMKEGM